MDEFDRAWRQKLSKQIESEAGATLRDEILAAGDDNINAATDSQEIFSWTRAAMIQIESELDEQTSRDILTGCACHYPDEQLKQLRSIYRSSGDIQRVHEALQQQFERFLQETLQLEESLIATVVARGWGAAGILDDNKIIATKIPKSGYLERYLQENDPEIRRSYYCHCPRVRDAVGSDPELPLLYCYCGAGFYKHMWETILEQRVTVEVLESVLSSGNLCKVLITLPERH